MKAILADFSLGREVWGRVRAKIFRREERVCTPYPCNRLKFPNRPW